MWERIKVWWCSVTHGGGRIERDDQGRINWRCARCGRWSDHPVSRFEEARTVDREIEYCRKRQSS